MNQTKIEIKDSQITFGSVGLQRLIGELEDGAYMVLFEEWKEAKTLRQLAFFHGPLVKAYSEYTGEPYEDAKFNLKKRYGVNRLVYDSRSDRKELQIRSLREYSIDEMQVFLQRVLDHLEFDCGFVIDSKTRQQFQIDHETGEMVEA